MSVSVIRTALASAVALAAALATASGSLAQDPPGPTVLVAMEAATALGSAPRMIRPGLRVEAVLPSGVSPYVTLGVHPAPAVSCFRACLQPGRVREAMAGVNYRPDLGSGPLRLFIGAGYGILHDRDRPSPDGTLDVHAGLELRTDGVGVRGELRRLVDPDRDTFNGAAAVFGLFAQLPPPDREGVDGAGGATGAEWILAPELAVAPELDRYVLRPGLRVERTHPSGLAGYGTVGIHRGDSPFRSGGQVVDIVAGINYRPDLGLDPFRLYVGGGYGVFQYQATAVIRLATDLHGGVELLHGAAGLRLELRYANERRYWNYAPAAFVVAAFVEI